MTRQLLDFGMVGALAGATHLGVAAWMTSGGLHPLVANVLAFHVAFPVSYVGHHRLTFRDAGGPALRSLPRFLMVAYAGFALNELLYALLLVTTRLHYLAALVIVLAIVAVSTFLLSRLWAFHSN